MERKIDKTFLQKYLEQYLCVLYYEININLQQRFIKKINLVNIHYSLLFQIFVQIFELDTYEDEIVINRSQKICNYVDVRT